MTAFLTDMARIQSYEGLKKKTRNDKLPTNFPSPTLRVAHSAKTIFLRKARYSRRRRRRRLRRRE